MIVPKKMKQCTTCNLSVNATGGCCGGWAGGNPRRVKETIHQRFNDLVFTYCQEWAATEKGLINYCRVEWIDKKG